MTRKRDAITDAIDEWEAKRMRSLRPLVASPVSSSPAVDAIEQARRSEERACTHKSSGPAPARDSQWEDDPPAAPVGVPQAKGRGDSRTGQEPIESTPPPAERPDGDGVEHRPNSHAGGLEAQPTACRGEWRGGGDRVVAANPSLPGVVLLGSAVSTAAVMVAVLAAIPVVTAEATLEVSLAAPPPPATVKEERATGLPSSSSEGLHGSPSRSELKVSRGVVGPKPERLSVAHETEVVEIPSDDEADDVVKLPVPLRELAVVQSEAGLSSRQEETDLEWPCPEDPTKDRAAKVSEVRAAEQLTAKRATAVEQGLEAAMHQKSLADTKATLQGALETSEVEWSALASEQKARSEVNQEVLTLRGQVMGTEEANTRLREQLGGKVESLERGLETAKAMFGQNAEALAKSLEERRALEGELDQIHNVSQLVVSEVFGSAPSTDAPAIQLA
ncbi:uncharacterized protein [Miscanthus floridulus]|uniref:uncharacterized protein n=1 Tax=Miscanthus floridulus TaxID=154761 RepID=UPI003458280C